MDDSYIYAADYQPEFGWRLVQDLPDGRTRVLTQQDGHLHDRHSTSDIMLLQIVDLKERRKLLYTGGIYASMTTRWADGLLYLRAESGTLDPRPDVNVEIDFAGNVFRLPDGDWQPFSNLKPLLESSFGCWGYFYDKDPLMLGLYPRKRTGEWIVAACFAATALATYWWLN
jgi:hypothetical protein